MVLYGSIKTIKIMSKKNHFHTCEFFRKKMLQALRLGHEALIKDCPLGTKKRKVYCGEKKVVQK